MEIDPKNFDAVIMAKVNEKIALTNEKAQEIGRRIGIDMQSEIIAGNAKPESIKMSNTTKYRRKQGEQTLYKTGEYAARFEGEMANENEVWITNRSHVSPRWRNIFQRTLSVVNMETVKRVLREVLFANR